MLARHAELSTSQLGKIERGGADLSLSTFDKIANGLGLSYGGLARLVQDELDAAD